MASIRKLPNGKFQAQFRPVPGGKQITKTATRKIDVQMWLDEQNAALLSGSYISAKSSSMTFAQFYAEWSPRQIWEATSRDAYDRVAASVTFADMPLAKIKRAHVELWIKSMLTADRGVDADGNQRPTGLAPMTIKNRVDQMRTILRGAIADQRLAVDPSVGVRLPATRKRSASMTIPTTEQVTALLDASDEQYRMLFTVCAFAGLRLGEASGLKVRDIDFLRRTIDVRRQVQRKRGGIEIRLPKYGSERTIAAAPLLLDLLAAHMSSKSLTMNDRDAFLFATKFDNPYSPSQVHHGWDAARAAVESSVTIHDLRHYYASGLIAAGCDVSTVQHALGHSSPSVTLNTYTHLWPNADDRTRAAAQSMMTSAFVSPEERSASR